MTEVEILEGLRDERVCHVRRQTAFKDGERRDTNLLVLSFETSRLPTHLLAGHLRYEVRVFIPNPLRCFKCQRFGHGTKTCRQSARCMMCGEPPHDGSGCTSPRTCLNCESSEHVANSTHCPTWKKEKEVCSLVAKTGVTYLQARRVIEARSPADKTYAQAAAITSVSCGTQTDNIPSLPPLQLLAPVSATPTAVTPTQTLSEQAPERVVAGRAADRRPATTRPQVGRPSSPAVADQSGTTDGSGRSERSRRCC